jgi:hypothetical protein
MWTGKTKAAGLAMAVGLAVFVLAACGSSGSGGTTVSQAPPISADTADHLAKLSDRVASDLDSGDTCGAAHAADELRSAVEDADLPEAMRPDVDAVAGRLVDEVNCPAPPPPPEPKKKPKSDTGDQQHGPGEHPDEHPVPPGHAKHGGPGPPGQAKLHGEPE